MKEYFASKGFFGLDVYLTTDGYLIRFYLLDDEMQNASYIITLIGTLVLLASGAAWWNTFRPRELAQIAGRLEQDTRRANSAAIATVAAFSLSVVAAILSMIGWLR